MKILKELLDDITVIDNQISTSSYLMGGGNNVEASFTLGRAFQRARNIKEKLEDLLGKEEQDA